MNLSRRVRPVPTSIEPPSITVLLAAIAPSFAIAQWLQDRRQALSPSERQAAERVPGALLGGKQLTVPTPQGM